VLQKGQADAITDALNSTDLQDLTDRYAALKTISSQFTPDQLGSEQHQNMIKANASLANNRVLSRIAAKYSAMDCYWEAIDTNTNLVKAGNTQTPPV
jgi:hypothetical protein